MTKGIIRRLLEHRGFGFIHTDSGRDESGRDVFFHRSQVLNIAFEALREGQAVEFVIEETSQGPKALRVRAIAETRTVSIEASQ